MKHSLKITFMLLATFFCAQLLGLVILSNYIDIEQSAATGETVLFDDQYFIEPPEVEQESSSFILIMVLVFVGTGLVLLLIKFRQRKLWKVWFLLSVVITLSFALYPFIQKGLMKLSPVVGEYALNITLFIALLFGIWKVFRPNVYVHNLTELFIYGGLASLLVPIINVVSAFFLLTLISGYDIYAVRKSKHMVKMAKFQSESKLFAGLFLPYGNKPIKEIKVTEGNPKSDSTHKVAVLGGGDIAFPLFFTGALLKTTASWPAALIVVAGATIGLSLLLLHSKKGKFYPAMPPIAAGCFLGYLVTLLL